MFLTFLFVIFSCTNISWLFPPPDTLSVSTCWICCSTNISARSWWAGRVQNSLMTSSFFTGSTIIVVACDCFRNSRRRCSRPHKTTNLHRSVHGLCGSDFGVSAAWEDFSACVYMWLNQWLRHCVCVCVRVCMFNIMQLKSMYESLHVSVGVCVVCVRECVCLCYIQWNQWITLCVCVYAS